MNYKILGFYIGISRRVHLNDFSTLHIGGGHEDCDVSVGIWLTDPVRVDRPEIYTFPHDSAAISHDNRNRANNLRLRNNNNKALYSFLAGLLRNNSTLDDLQQRTLATV